MRRVPKLGWIAAGAVAVGAVAAAVVVLTRPSASVAATMRTAGCKYADAVPYPPKDWKTLADYHADVPTLSSPVRWKTFPPSGGSHYRLWATWGFYTKPVNPRQVVHNEEHGAVVLWWGPKVPQSTISQLQDFYESSPVGMFGTPIAGLGNKIALTAWTGDPAKYYRNGYYGIGHLAICSRFDEKAFTAFRDAYRGKGPEGIPLSSDAPGLGP